MVEEAAVPAEDGEPIPVSEWTTWDLGRAHRALRTGDPALQTRALRRLHVKWWHASAKRMLATLQAAGVPDSVKALVQSVVDTCRICRMRQRPRPKSMVSNRLSTRIGEAVQMDLLFVEAWIMLHLIYEATRWTMATFLMSKRAADVLESIATNWLRIFGAMDCLISDREGALADEEVATRAERWGIRFRLKP